MSTRIYRRCPLLQNFCMHRLDPFAPLYAPTPKMWQPTANTMQANVFVPSTPAVLYPDSADNQATRAPWQLARHPESIIYSDGCKLPHACQILENKSIQQGNGVWERASKDSHRFSTSTYMTKTRSQYLPIQPKTWEAECSRQNLTSQFLPTSNFCKKDMKTGFQLQM